MPTVPDSAARPSETLVVYGDFNCPFSALASARVDELLARDLAVVSWRAIEHDPAIPLPGTALGAEDIGDLQAEIETVAQLSANDVRLRLELPSRRHNTSAANAAFAAAWRVDRHRLRRRIFAAVWAEGRGISSSSELDRLDARASDRRTARRWQAAFDALPAPVAPSLVTGDGTVLQGFDALAQLADLLKGAQRQAGTRDHVIAATVTNP